MTTYVERNFLTGGRQPQRSRKEIGNECERAIHNGLTTREAGGVSMVALLFGNYFVCTVGFVTNRAGLRVQRKRLDEAKIRGKST